MLDKVLTLNICISFSVSSNCHFRCVPPKNLIRGQEGLVLLCAPCPWAPVSIWVYGFISGMPYFSSLREVLPCSS